MKFNEKLLDLRRQKGWSQEELGNKLDVSRQTISKWEIGATTPELENLVMLSEIFEISIDELVDNPRTQTVIQENNTKAEENEIISKPSKSKKKILWVIIIIIFLLSGVCGFIYFRSNILRKANIRMYDVALGITHVLGRMFRYTNI